MGILQVKRVVSENIKEDLKNHMIRFHVRANSDNQRDQGDKLKVRDAVVDYMRSYMEQANSKEKAVEILQKKKEGIKNIAIYTLRKSGNDSQVKVYLTTEMFPERDYGEYIFPPGKYDALRIDIGEAKGHNWWCVMFPDLCVTKDDKTEINQKAKEKMQKILGKHTVHSIEKNQYLRWLFH